MFLSFLLPVVELMKNDEKWWNMIKKWKKHEKKMKNKLEENCNFPKNEKLQFSLSFFIFFFFFFFHFFAFFFIFHHFCFQCSKNFPKNKKNAIFLEFFSFFYHFLSFFYHFCFQWWVELMKNDEKWWKMIKKWKKLEENCNFPFFRFFFAPLEEKMFKKW